MEQLPTITYVPITGYRTTLQCNDGTATLNVFADGEFNCVACPKCIVLVPGYFHSLEADEITNIWNVIRTFNGKPVVKDGKTESLGHIYGLNAADALERASKYTGDSAFTVRRLYASQISRMMKGTPAPSDLEIPGKYSIVSGSYTVIAEDDMGVIREKLRQQPAQTNVTQVVGRRLRNSPTGRKPATPPLQTTNYFVQEENAGAVNAALADVVCRMKDEASRQGRTVAGEIVVGKTEDGKPVSFDIKFSD